MIEWEGSLLGRRHFERVGKVSRATERHDGEELRRGWKSSDGLGARRRKEVVGRRGRAHLSPSFALRRSLASSEVVTNRASCSLENEAL